MSIGKNIFRYLTTIAIAMVCACSDGCDGGSTPPPGPTLLPIDQSLLLAPGTVWLDTYQDGFRDGFVFLTDKGKFISFRDYGGTALPAFDPWIATDTGTIQTDALGNLEVKTGWLYYSLEEGKTASYAVNAAGDMLTVTIELSDKQTVVDTFTAQILTIDIANIPLPIPAALGKVAGSRPARKR